MQERSRHLFLAIVAPGMDVSVGNVRLEYRGYGESRDLSGRGWSSLPCPCFPSRFLPGMAAKRHKGVAAIFAAGSEARDSGIATDRAGLLAGNSPTKPSSLLATLGKLPTKPRQSHCGLRFRGRGDAPVSGALCVCGHGNREP